MCDLILPYWNKHLTKNLNLAESASF